VSGDDGNLLARNRDMLKLTAFCPADASDAVVYALQQEPLVSHVVRLPAVETEAGKDMVIAFLRDQASDSVLARLRAVRDWEAGELSFIAVDMVVRHDLAQLDAAEVPGEEEGTLGWEMILVRAQQEARLSWQYLTFMACAGMIATLGLIHDLPILIVGAMSLSPDLAPANAIAVALTAGAFRRMSRALGTLVAGLAVAIVLAFGVSAALRSFGLLEGGILLVNDTLTTFVTVVDAVTIIVAIVAGVAAMVAFTTAQGLAAVGVAISVTTIPAASYAGVALAFGAFELALDALGVLAVNVLFLTLAQCLTLVLIRTWRQRQVRQAAV
jgi:uncharacterized hydrophobic protein (TIGR00271 family)